MRILELRASNIKKLKVVEIRPQGPLVQLTGRNGNGKTSVLDAISYALEGTEGLPSMVIRRGEAGAWTQLKVGDPATGLAFTVLRSFSEKSNNLIVKSAVGARYPSPQDFLNKLMSHLGFDPLAFMRMKPRDQVDELRKLVKLGFDPEELERENADDYRARTEANRALKTLEAQLAAVPEPVPDLPAQPIEIAELISQMEVAGTRNAAIVALTGQVEKWREHAKTEKQNAESQRERAKQLRQAAAEADAAAQKLDESALAWMKKAEGQQIPEPVDTAKLREEIANAEATNKQIEKRESRAKLLAERDAIDQQVTRLTSQMEAREAQKTEAIAAAKLPVKGLSFTSGEVMYNGIPISQASSSEQLRVSVAIAMAANPKLRILRISDGSLLDEESLEMVRQMGEKENYQIWIERVDSSGQVGIVMVDGEVAAVNEEKTREVKGRRAPKKAAQKEAVQ